MRGRLIRRYKRFLADIETPEGEVITAYCPATGRMTTCSRRGAPVEYFRVEGPQRSLDYDWWSIRMDETWVVIDTRPANGLVHEHRRAAWLPEAWGEASWVAEPALEEGGRLDYRLEGNGAEEWVEVKSVTWCEDHRGYFPDAPTERGRRHLNSLIRLRGEGRDACLVLVAMRDDIETIVPAEEVDPDFASLLGTAREHGVRILGIGARTGPRSIELTGRVPVRGPG